MDKVQVSAFENVLQFGDVPMGNVVIIGDRGMGKTELTKQLIGSLLNSRKHVLVFDINDQFRDLVKRVGGILTDKIDISLKSSKFLVVNSLNVDFRELKELLFNPETEWIVVVEDIDKLLATYQQDEQMRNFVDFIFYIGTFGRIYHTYTIITGRKLSRLMSSTPTRELVNSSKNYICLKQKTKAGKNSLRLILTPEQIAKVERLQRFNAVLFRKEKG